MSQCLCERFPQSFDARIQLGCEGSFGCTAHTRAKSTHEQTQRFGSPEKRSLVDPEYPVRSSPTPRHARASRLTQRLARLTCCLGRALTTCARTSLEVTAGPT